MGEGGRGRSGAMGWVVARAAAWGQGPWVCILEVVRKVAGGGGLARGVLEG